VYRVYLGGVWCVVCPRIRVACLSVCPFLRPDISETTGDTGLFTIGSLQETKWPGRIDW